MLAVGARGMVSTGRSMVQSSLSNTDIPFKRKDRIFFFFFAETLHMFPQRVTPSMKPDPTNMKKVDQTRFSAD